MFLEAKVCRLRWLAALALLFPGVAAAQIFVTAGNAVSEYTSSGALMNASLITGLASATAIAVSPTDLFIYNSGSGSIGEYTLAGATVNATLIAGLSNISALAVSGGNVFALDSSTGTVAEYSTSGALLNATLISGLSNPVAMAVSGNDLFILNASGNPTIGEYTTSGTTVNAALISGLEYPSMGNIQGSAPEAIAVAGSTVYVGYYYVALGPGNVMYSHIAAYTLSGAPVHSTIPDFPFQSPPVFLAADGSVLVWGSSETLYVSDASATNPATLSATPAHGIAVAGPAFAREPVAVSIAAGQTAAFSVSATGGTPPYSYQWEFNGTPLAGSNDPYLLLSDVSSGNSGSYSCVVTDASGIASPSTAATLSLNASTDIGRLMNVSVLANCGAGASSLIAGFVVGGRGNNGSPQPMLVRAVGPELGGFGLTGFLPDPTFSVTELVSGVSSEELTSIYPGAPWSANPANESSVLTADAETGAFPLTVGSLSYAGVETLYPGQYTENVASQSGDSGTALAEVYDTATAFTAATPRLINVSGRAVVSGSALSPANSLTAGFVIGGSTSITVLVRAIGPSLAGFGISEPLDAPTLTVYSSNLNLPPVAGNTGWSSDPVLAQAAADVGAFPLAQGSADSVLLLTLAPGAYTAAVTSADGSTGGALIELYEVQ